jgi:tetratricopeptide (TPR) repeat protein
VISSFLLPTLLFSIAQADLLNEHLSKYAVGPIEKQKLQPTRAAERAYVTGRDLAASDKHSQAISYYLQSAELDDTSPSPWAAMAHSLEEIGRLDAAFKAWSEVLLRDPVNEQALFVIGLDSAMGGEYQKAVQLLSRLRLQEIERTPTDELLQDVALSTALEKIGDKETSDLFRSHQTELISASFEQLMHGNDALWLSIMQQLVDLRDPNVALQLASMAAPKLDKQRQAAVLSAMPVIEVASGGDGSVTLNTYKQIGRNELVPTRPRWFEPVTLAYALSIAAQSMSSVGGVDSAISLYEASIALDSTDVVAVNNLAWLLLLRDGATEKAVEIAQNAYDLDHSAGFVQDTVGYAKLLQGFSNEAIDLFLNALKETGDDPQILDHLADAYWKAHQRRDAISAWQRAYSTLRSPEYYKIIVEGFQETIYSVWGISIATPEALYDLEIGTVVRRLQEKLIAVQEGRDPFEPKKNGDR